jgi:hypothetical protein
LIAYLATIWMMLSLPLRVVVCPNGLEIIRYSDQIRVGCVVAADPVWRYGDSYLINGQSVARDARSILLSIGDQLPAREMARCVAWLEQ